jgi:osmotically-inducible protein OsmY
MKTNELLRKDVCAELVSEPSVNAGAIAVTVDDGIVTLAGTVDSYAEELAAERAVKRVAGVKGVVEEMQVAMPGAVQRTDEDIAKAAVRALQWNVSVPADRIRVTVERGGITLEGEVNWQFQRQAAHNAVCDLPGVKCVNNQIAIKPGVTASDVKARIESAFTRNVLLDAQGITVSVSDDTVTLNGAVRSLAEREEAERAAWATPGVAFVDDRLTVRQDS